MPVVNGVPVLLPPPDGYVVDFDNPQRRSVEASYIVASIGMVISTFFMLQRLYVKSVLRNNLGVDDLLLVFAWIGAVAIQGLLIYSFHELIMGVHVWEIPIDKFKKFALIGGYVTSIVYTVPTTLAKIVILLFYREINNPADWYHWSIHSMMFIVTGSGIAILLSSMFPCRPFAKNYDIAFADVGWCINRPAMYQATAAIGVATDVLIFAIPIPMVIGLRMSNSKKIGLIAMFAVGSATVVTSMIRLALLISSLDDVDQTWGGGPICLWICIEANLLIICASLSTVRHFFQAVAPRLISSTSFGSRKTMSKTPSTNHELRTFGAGSARNRAYYSRFDETDTGTDTIVNVQGLPPQEKEDKFQDREPEDSDKRTETKDNLSDKVIVQTKTTHVYYEYI